MQMPSDPSLLAPHAAAAHAAAKPSLPDESRTLRYTRGYERLLQVMFALTPLVGILYLHLFQDPALKLEHHLLHEIAIGAAIALSAFVCWVTWRCYESSGEPVLRWLTLGFLGFTLIYAPHGALTRLADHNLPLFLLFGPASRLVMVACLFHGLLQYGRPPEDPAALRHSGHWWRWAAAFVLIDVLVVLLALSPWAASPWIRLPLEGGALTLALAAVGVMIVRRIQAPLMLIYMIALAAFAQSSLAFLLSLPWNHQWWLAHTIFAAGFFLLSYGVVQAFHTTRAFSSVYSQEEMIRRLEAANAELRRLAATDPLTGASNRRHFMGQLAVEWARAQREEAPLALLAIDLDHFKRINDQFGHQAGDEVLRSFAAETRALLRPADLIGRTGGEEFAILLPGTDTSEAAVVAERVRAHIAALRMSSLGRQPMPVTVSIGTASFGVDGNEAEAVFRAADRRLYAAKHGGRNQVVSGPAV